MDTISVNTRGESIIPTSYDSCLTITWHKVFNETYCHHALFIIPKHEKQIKETDLAQLTVKMRVNIIDKGQIKSFSDKEITRFLPIKLSDDSIHIPLNSPEILDALCENGWTTMKDGKRGAAKSFPLSLSLSFPNTDKEHHIFATELGKFPFTLFEEHLTNLKDGEKIDTEIYFVK